MTKSTQRNKDKLLKLLEQNPNLLRASKLVGVARATVYRWLASDPEFAERLELAQEIGRDSLVDFAEAKLLKNVEAGQHNSIAYFLSHNSPRYASNAVQERHSKHRNIGRLAKLPEGTDSVYLYPQTESIEMVQYYMRMTDSANKLKSALDTSSTQINLDEVDPLMAKLFLSTFPEAVARFEQQQIKKYRYRS